MDALVIEGKKKSDYDIFIRLAKKLGLKAHLVSENLSEIPNDETILAMLDAEKGNVCTYKNATELLSSLKKKTKNA